MNYYTAGDVIRLSATFGQDGNPIDPSIVQIIYRVGSANPVVLTYGEDASVIRDSVGNYHADVDSTGLAGTWVYEGASGGVGQGIEPDSLVVGPAPIVPDFS